MSQSADIRVLPVPSHLVDAMWSHVSPWLSKGVTAGATTLARVREDIANDTDRLWVVFQDEKPVAAFVTAVYVDQGSYLGVYALGGRGVWRWARDIYGAMQVEARSRGVDRVRFVGRKGWSRVLPRLDYRGPLGPYGIWEFAA